MADVGEKTKMFVADDGDSGALKEKLVEESTDDLPRIMGKRAGASHIKDAFPYLSFLGLFLIIS